MRRTFSNGITGIIVVGVVLVAIQILATMRNANQVESKVQEIVGPLRQLQDKNLSDEKTREEVLTLRIQNAMRGFFWNSLLITIGLMVTAFVALVGSLLGLRSYLDARDKEHRDRQDAQNRDLRDRKDAQDKEQQDREKERLDRASVELKDTIERLVHKEPGQRAAGIVGLEHFLTTGTPEYQLWALSALVMAARREDDREVTSRPNGSGRCTVSAPRRSPSLQTRCPAKIFRRPSWAASTPGARSFSDASPSKKDRICSPKWLPISGPEYREPNSGRSARANANPSSNSGMLASNYAEASTGAIAAPPSPTRARCLFPLGLSRLVW